MKSTQSERLNALKEIQWNELVKKKTGITKDMYALKHTGAIAALKAGVPITEIQKQLRHTSLETTQEYLQSMTVDLNSPIATQFPEIIPV